VREKTKWFGKDAREAERCAQRSRMKLALGRDDRDERLENDKR